jgi:hypothetical protein
MIDFCPNPTSKFIPANLSLHFSGFAFGLSILLIANIIGTPAGDG